MKKFLVFFIFRLIDYGIKSLMRYNFIIGGKKTITTDYVIIFIKNS